MGVRLLVDMRLIMVGGLFKGFGLRENRIFQVLEKEGIEVRKGSNLKEILYRCMVIN